MEKNGNKKPSVWEVISTIASVATAIGTVILAIKS